MFISTTKDGYLVYDRYTSHIHHQAIPFLEQAIESIVVGEQVYLVQEIQFDTIISYSTCVCTTSEDEICFAQRINRKGLSRFVKYRQPEPSRSMVIVLMKDNSRHNTYILITAYVGSKGVVEPWDWGAHVRSHDPMQSYQASVTYWNSHALLWDEKEIIQGSETIHPWH